MPPTNPSTLHPNPSLAALPYNSALSLWLSVDPLSDKYPNLSPYAYCANNPVRLVDKDGREWLTPEDAEYAQKLISIAQKEQYQYEVGSDAYNRLQEGIDGLTFMGKTKDYTITFSSSAEKNQGNVTSESGIIHINYLDSKNDLVRQDGSAWHETVHLTRYFKQGTSYACWEENWRPGQVVPSSKYGDYGYRIGPVLSYSTRCYEEEVYTFQSQFYFSNKSLPPTAIGLPREFEDIPNYVRNAYNCPDSYSK